ncbi:cadherin-like beta sandwich domain-containing protein [Undibacterium sp.]|uniref:cadherin-like beta sandwich domain-containing protein n=1 Tax=Undibacterium sp. TaxID=1914977 RepID=UPI00374D6980
MNSPSNDTRILSRRKALLLGAFGATALAGCGSGSGSTAAAASGTATVVSKDDTLSSLTLSSGSLSPAFSSVVDLYTVTVANSVSSITVTPASTSAAAIVKINGGIIVSGTASGVISLAVGTTNVTVAVTAEDGVTISTITISVIRAAAVSAENLAIIAQDEIGPFPLLAILSNAAIVRKDVRETKTGLPLTLNLTLTNINNQSQPLTNAAVYIWQCDKDGEYSGYSSQQNGNHQGETYLRGIQITDSKGQVSFTTIYPGWYTGRVTHIHAQIYLNDNLNVTATTTTQFAFPDAVNTAVYSTALYTHGQNTSVASNAADHVFSDGTSTQMLSLTGDTTNGYVATLNISMAA